MHITKLHIINQQIHSPGNKSTENTEKDPCESGKERGAGIALSWNQGKRRHWTAWAHKIIKSAHSSSECGTSEYGKLDWN